MKDFGTFLPEVKSQSSEDPEEVGVKRVRISFRPHKTLWEAVGQIGYVTENEFTEGEEDNESGGGTTGGGNDDQGGQDFT